jgi:hypothetical protein
MLYKQSQPCHYNRRRTQKDKPMDHFDLTTWICEKDYLEAVSITDDLFADLRVESRFVVV